MTLSEEFKLFVRNHESDNVRDIALQASRYPDIDIRAALQQIQGRQIAKRKLPEWYRNVDVIFPSHISMEQCSSEYTARFKASLCNGKILVDLTGGLGVDFYYMAQKFDTSVFVERNVDLVDLAAHNLSALGLENYNIEIDNAESYLQRSGYAEWIYIDPARRSVDGKKVFMLQDCSPDIVRIEPLFEKKADKVMIKLSPMLDITQSIESLNKISDIYIVSFFNECKELLFIRNNSVMKDSLTLHCVNIKSDNSLDTFSFKKEEEENSAISYTNSVGKYLYEPNTSFLKAGAYKLTASFFGVKKLHPNSHLYTSDSLCQNFQGRCFIVDNVYTFSKNDLKLISRLKQANITVRNLSLSANELKKRLKLSDGGNIFIFATTLADNKKVMIVCHKA